MDGLRAVAIIGIVIYLMYPRALPGGFLGVNVFFVLSGYLITVNQLAKTRSGEFSLGTYYKKRILRIYPELVLTLLTTCFFSKFLAPENLYGVRKEVLSVLLGYNNWWQISRKASYFTSNISSPLMQMWFIALELQFYLVFPLTLLLAGRGRLAARAGWVLAILAALSLLLSQILYQPHSDPTRVYFGTDTHAYALLIGSALGYLQMDSPQPADAGDRRLSTLRFCIELIVLVVLYRFTWGQEDIAYHLALPLSAVLAADMVYLCSCGTLPVGRWMDNPVLSLIGRYSYEIYLSMYPVIFFVRRSPVAAYPVAEGLLIVLLIAASSWWLHEVGSFFNRLAGKGIRSDKHTS